MDEDTSQLLMRLVPKGSSKALAAECRIELGGAAKEPLAEDFAPGYYFEVLDFDLGLDLKGDEVETGSAATSASHARNGHKPAVSGTPATKATTFTAWRTADPSRLKSLPPYPIVPDVLKFTRSMDRASPVLFKHYANRLEFGTAVLIKRLIWGETSTLQTVMRLELLDTALVDLSWTQGDVIRETLQLEYKKLTLSFRVQDDDGLLETASSASWPAAG